MGVPAVEPERVKPFPAVENGYVTRREQFKLRDGLVATDPSDEAGDEKDLGDAPSDHPASHRGRSKKARKPKRGKATASAAAEPTPKKPEKTETAKKTTKKKTKKTKKTKAIKQGKKAAVVEAGDEHEEDADVEAEPSAPSNPPVAVAKSKAKAKKACKPKATEDAAPAENDSKKKRVRLPSMGYEEPVADAVAATAA